MERGRSNQHSRVHVTAPPTNCTYAKEVQRVKWRCEGGGVATVNFISIKTKAPGDAVFFGFCKQKLKIIL